MPAESDDIAAILSPFIRVSPWTALHHHWQSPHPPFDMPPVAPTLWLIRQGVVRVTMPGREFELKAGMLFLSPPGVSRAIEVDGQADWFSVSLIAQAFQQLDLFSLLPSPGVRTLADGPREMCEALMGQLVREWCGVDIPSSINPARWFAYIQKRIANRQRQFDSPGGYLESALICEGIVRSLFALCWRQFAPIRLSAILQSNIPDWVALVLRRIDDEPGVAVTELARMAHLSATRFRIAFHELTGQSPQQYLTARRMETARHLLLSTNDTIASIASHAGMQSLPTFTRLFKAAHGMAPGRYRQTFSRTGVEIDKISAEKDK